jgi:8-oxo-dGTP pyrophosphatase MutT (NUDIX family)
VPYRLNASGDIEVLLVTSRRTRRWIIPKGWPIKGKTPAETAAREAFEEAGVTGNIDSEAMGIFSYEKQMNKAGRTVACEVQVFSLYVEHELAVWPESHQRELRWLSRDDAASLADDEGLRILIQKIAGLSRTPRNLPEIVH